MNDNPMQEPGAAIIIGEDMYTQEQFEQMRREEIVRLHANFAGMRDRWIQHRAQSGVELRWRRATEIYLGDDNRASNEFADTLKNGPAKRSAAGDTNRSRVVINIVRPKVDQAKARVSEILLPVDDRNWGIKPTPIPEVAKMTGDQRVTVNPATGQPTGMTADDEATIVMKAAKKAAEAMQNSIDDSLTECKYNGESRKVIDDGVLLGTGIMYGPFPARQSSKCWTTNEAKQHVIRENESIVPASMALDPWNVFFDPACGNDHQRGRGFFIRRDVTPRELRALDGLPGYDSDAIRTVLRSSPMRVRTAEGRVTRDAIQEGSYEMWQYHGDIDPDELEKMSSRTGDPLTDVSFGVIMMVNDTVIGAMESWVVDKTLPVDVWNWRKSDDSPFGYGLPDELEHQQRVVNAAWRQVMDNARTSMGGQIVMKRGMIIPENKSYEITPGKVWLAKDDVEDVGKAFTTFEFASHLQELLAIAQAAMQFADQETSMPQMMGGEKGTAPETVGGMIMLSNNANAVQRLRVKLYDDCITRPHIGRYYDWKMLNEEDDSIKGDYEIDARGSTALIERDIQNQALINLASITNNSRYIPHLDERSELKAILKAFKINPDDILKPEDQVRQEQQAAAEQGAPQDPRVVTAETQLKIKQLELQDDEEQREFDHAHNQDELALRRETLDYNKAREQSEHDIAMTDAQMARETTIARMNQDGQESQLERESKERLALVKIDSDRQLFAAEAAIKAQQGSGL